ncbi:MAG: class I SAM-dependent methyltransferase [Bryobacteraceae bacterium]|nr:class I SAM-dependent methyltransferase [Bryobacteraceae bacterium]
MNPSLDELQRAIAEIEERVRARHPQSAAGGEVPLPNLWPLLHARDAAEAKVAAIGHVNPRPGGLVNGLIQSVKRTVARGLNWFVRDQVEFNRASMQCIEAVLEALNESNRAHAELANRIARLPIPELRDEARELRDIRGHWSQWRQEWERKLTVNEAQFMRGLADLQLAQQQRDLLAQAGFRDKVDTQHQNYLGALDRATAQLQDKVSADLNYMRDELRREAEHLIHEELRLLRQRPAVVLGSAPKPEAELDWFTFANKFRGPEPKIREHFARYVPYFAQASPVLDLGCGRGEFLRLLRDQGVTARGLDLTPENIALCMGEGLSVELQDFFTYLPGLADGSLGGIFCAQVVEHLPAAKLPELIRLCAAKLKPGAPILF